MIKNCTLAEHECKGDCKGDCKYCGWNPHEVKRRKNLFANNGLKVCTDGLKRLIVKRGS